MTNKYSVAQYSVDNILGFINSGEISIPEIQRPFVWKPKNVRDLIDSLYNGYPTGYLIIWQNPNIRLKDGREAGGTKILIDGQQRVTALMTALAGKCILNEEYEQKAYKIAFNPLAQDDEERFAVQTPAHVKSKNWIPDISVVFKPGFNSYNFIQEYMQNNPEASSDIINNAIQQSLFSSRTKVSDLISVMGDVHHIFPKEYLKQNGFDDKSKYNQVANYTYLDTGVNISIGKQAPCEYFTKALEQCKNGQCCVGTILSEEELKNNLKTNCIPERVLTMQASDYDEFLLERRKMMAEKIKKYYYSI